MSAATALDLREVLVSLWLGEFLGHVASLLGEPASREHRVHRMLVVCDGMKVERIPYTIVSQEKVIRIESPEWRSR